MKKALIIILLALLSVVLCVSCRQDPPPTYVVSFNANGGTGAMNIQKTTGNSIKLIPNSFERTGYKFGGWSLSATGEVYCENEATIGLNSDVYLYAFWVPNKYTIHFDANEGTGTMPDIQADYDAVITLPANTYEYDTKFKNWSTTKSGEGTFYGDCDSVKNLTDADGGTVTLYAQWGRPIIYFNSNGGVYNPPMEPLKVEAGKVATLTKNTCERHGWHFGFWCVSPTGIGQTYKDEGKIVTEKDMVLYVQWVPNTYTVKFDRNGGSGEMADEEFTYHTYKALSKNSFTSPETGLVFDKWKVKGSDKTFLDGEIVRDLTEVDKGVVTLEAQWVEGLNYRDAYLGAEEGHHIYLYNVLYIHEREVTFLDKDSTQLKDGWYAVTENLTVKDRMVVSGDAQLILFDGATLTAEKGISVDSGKTLTIRDQKGGTGKLVVSNPDSGMAGIGGGKDKNAGDITVHGGELDIRGGDGGAGIGGMKGGSNGAISIYGGTVKAESGNGGAGIGAGENAGQGGLINLRGGKIEAFGHGGAGIGGGKNYLENNGEVVIRDKVEVVATGESGSAGIGGGLGGKGGFVNMEDFYDAKVTATGGVLSSGKKDEVIGSGIGAGGKNLDQGTIDYWSVSIKVSSDGKKWNDYNDKDRKRYMKVEAK